MYENITPNLRNTMSSKHIPFFKFVMQTFLSDIVVPSGYPFFEWSGRVYAVKKDNAYEYPDDTGLLYDQLS